MRQSYFIAGSVLKKVSSKYGKNVSIPGFVNLMCDHHMKMWWFEDTVSFNGFFPIFDNRLRYSFKKILRLYDFILYGKSTNPWETQYNSQWMWVRALGTVTTCHIGNYLVTAKLYIICRYTRRTHIEPMWCFTFTSASWTTASLSLSRAEVASSNKRILGLEMSARAMAIRCFCPPLMCVPCCPTSVSYFCNHCKRQCHVDNGGGLHIAIKVNW